MACDIYDKRPQICKQFPLTPGEIKEFPGCTYWFDAMGFRRGYCDPRCAECCVDIILDGQKYKVCPHRRFLDGRISSD